MLGGPGLSRENQVVPKLCCGMCCWIAEMPLSNSQVKAEQAGPGRSNVSVGNSLILVIESESRGGGKSFDGRMHFLPGSKGK